MKTKILTIVLLFFSFFGFSQSKKIYVFKEQYNKFAQGYINENPVQFGSIKILTNGMILSNKGHIDLNKIEKNLTDLYPNYDSDGVLCIDLENTSYEVLKGFNTNRKKKASMNQFREAEKEFIRMIKFIKNKRPKLKVGFYGMPFKVYEKSEIRKGHETSLDKILRETDVLFPSLYIPELADQNNLEENLFFLKINLDMSLTYGKRLNKPVIPFFWYLTFSPNINTRYELIPKEEIKTYIDYILSYELTGREASGIVWWDTSTPFYKKNKGMIKHSKVKQESVTSKSEINQSEIFFYYHKK